MKAKIPVEGGREVEIDGEASEIIAVMRLFKTKPLPPSPPQRKLSETEPHQIILGDNAAIRAKYPDWFWGNSHQQRARKAMKELGLSDPKQAVSCPRCGLEIKPEGVYIDGGSWSRMSLHVGGSICMARQQYGDITQTDLIRLNNQKLKAEMEAGVRPLCACGCGNPVQYYPQGKTWHRFYNGHNSETASFKAARDILISDIKEGEFQDDFRRRKRLSSRDASRLLRRLEKDGKIERRRARNGARWTLAIYKVTDESVKAGRNAKGV